MTGIVSVRLKQAHFDSLTSGCNPLQIHVYSAKRNLSHSTKLAFAMRRSGVRSSHVHFRINDLRQVTRSAFLYLWQRQ